MVIVVCTASVLTAILCAAFLSPMRRLAIAWNIIDVPSGRKAHAQPIPLLGGVAMYLSLLIVGVGVTLLTRQTHLIAIFGAALLLVVVGVIDDRAALAAGTKTAFEIAAVLLMIGGGLRFDVFGRPAADVVLTILFVLAVTNAFNLLDNMDGLAAGLGAIAAAAFAVIGVVTDAPDVALLAAAIVGACAGFLPRNFPKARMFMGDAGALMLGFLISALAILTSRSDHGISGAGTLVVLALPMIDTSLIIVSRLRRGVNPFTTPGTDHVSHRLATRFGGRRTAVVICWWISGLAAITGTWIVVGRAA